MGVERSKKGKTRTNRGGVMHPITIAGTALSSTLFETYVEKKMTLSVVTKQIAANVNRTAASISIVNH